MRNYGLAIKFLAVAAIFGVPYQMFVGDSTFLFALLSAVPGFLMVVIAWAIWKVEAEGVNQ